MISPPSCFEGKEITKVPNMPLDFSVLQLTQAGESFLETNDRDSLLLMGFEYCTFFV